MSDSTPATAARQCPRECSEHHTFKPPCLAGGDWTRDETGRSNSSIEFLTLVAEVEHLIRADAHMLLSGRADRTARLIVAQLAHRFGLAPQIGLAPENDRLRRIEQAAREVMDALQEHGAGIVGHLLDDDNNSGQRLRQALAQRIG